MAHERINVAELLKDTPKGMPLDCTMFENVTFVRVDMSRKQFPIEIAVGGTRSKYLTKEGCFHDTTLMPESKCVIYPKGKTTWEGFVPPCQFKDGDVIFTCTGKYTWVSIFKQFSGSSCCTYVDLYMGNNELTANKPTVLCNREDIAEQRLATEEEKEKLFKAIRDNGYKWSPETKTLEEEELIAKARKWFAENFYQCGSDVLPEVGCMFDTIGEMVENFRKTMGL